MFSVGAKEVDYVLMRGNQLAAIEVKSSVAESVSGMREFKARYPRTKTYLVGGQGMSIDEFMTIGAKDLL